MITLILLAPNNDQFSSKVIIIYEGLNLRFRPIFGLNLNLSLNPPEPEPEPMGSGSGSPLNLNLNLNLTFLGSGSGSGSEPEPEPTPHPHPPSTKLHFEKLQWIHEWNMGTPEAYEYHKFIITPAIHDLFRRKTGSWEGIAVYICLLAMFATTTTFEFSARAGARKGGFPHNLNSLNKHGAKCEVRHFFSSR